MGDSAVDASTTVSVPIVTLFDDIKNRLTAQDRSVGQRLTTQDNLLRRIDERLDGTATKADIDRIDDHLRRHDDELRSLKERVDESDLEKTFRQKLQGRVGWFVAAVMVPLGAAIIIVVATHTH